MEAIAPLVGEVLGVERAPIEIVEDGVRHSVRIGNAIDFEIEDIVPFGIQTGEPVRLVGEMLGVERAEIEVIDDGVRHSVRIGDAIDFEIEDIVPFGIETGEPVRLVGMFHPAGSELTGGEAKRSRINAFGIAYEGKTGLSTSEFTWAA